MEIYGYVSRSTRAAAQRLSNLSCSTETPSLGLLSNNKRRFSYAPPSSEFVPKVLPLLSTAGPRANLKQFSSFRTRYYNSDTGKASSRWLLTKIREYTARFASTAQKAIITVKPFKHNWKQDSVVPRQLPIMDAAEHILFTDNSYSPQHDG